MSTVPPSLRKVVAQLAAHYGQPESPITTDPFELILLENIAYLVSDERREEAFKALRKCAGTKPHQLLAASHDDILRATKLGGMHPQQRVNRLKEIALIAMNEFGGDLKQALKLPLRKPGRRCESSRVLASRARKRFCSSRALIRYWVWIQTACAYSCGWVLVKKRKTTQRLIGRRRKQSGIS